MSQYELTLLFDPNLGEEKITAVATKIEDKIKSLGAEIEKIDKWGVRRLASIIQKGRRIGQAYYIIVYFKGETSVAPALQGYLKVTENVLRYMISKAVPKAPEPPKKEVVKPEAEVSAVSVGEIAGQANITGAKPGGQS